MNEIQLASTDDLLNELLSRHDHAVFMGIKLPRKEEILSLRRWKGNSYTCCGLCDSLKKTILNDYEKGETKISDDEC